MALPITLLALLVIIGVALALTALMGIAAGWSLLGLAGFAVAAGILLVLRHRHAAAFLRLVAICWSPLGPVLLIALLLRPRDSSLAAWAAPAVGLVFAAGVASVVAIYAGFAYLRSTAGSQ